MTVTLLTMQTLTGSGTAIITLLPYPQSPKNLIGSARITKVILGSPGEQLLHLLHTSYATESGWDRSPPAGSTYLCIFSWTNKQTLACMQNRYTSYKRVPEQCTCTDVLSPRDPQVESN